MENGDYSQDPVMMTLEEWILLSIKVANPYGLSVRTTEFDLFHSLTAVGPKSYGYKIILRV